MVFRARQKERLERAIKVICPRDELRDRQDSEQFLATWDAEIAILAGVTHTRIAKIIDFGEAAHDEGILPYMVAEYIEGAELHEMWQDEALTGTAFLDLITHVLEALEYLHRELIMHCDVKGSNVRVRTHGGAPSAVLLDLGVAKVLKPSQPPRATTGAAQAEAVAPRDLETRPRVELGDLVDRDLADVTLFFSTPRITRPEWQHFIESDVSRDQLAEMFPGHDLFSVGVLLGEALERSPVTTAIERDLGMRTLEAVHTIRDRLLAPLGQEHYTSAAQVRADWSKLRPGYLSPLSIGELAVGASARTSLATPAGRVSITDRVFTIINHPLFQRLRNIPQLELASLLYPGANHTRFLHSLSIFDTTRRFVSHLLNDPNFLLLVEATQVEAVLLNALLHDIGHYPLSHMFEDFSEAERLGRDERLVPSDDELFWVFVAPQHAPDEFRDFSEEIERGLPAGESTLSELLVAGGPRGSALIAEDVLDAMARIARPRTPADSVVAGILSCPVDADKVAYLTDDSLMTGVRYGLGIDVDALLAALRAPRPADIPPGVRVIAIRDKGLTAAEGVVLARYWMLRRVYWHHTNRAIIAMVKVVVERLMASGEMTMREYFRQTLFSDLAEALAFLSQRFDGALSGDGELGAQEWVNPIPGLQGGNRRIYKRLFTVSRGTDPAGYEALAGVDSEKLSELDTAIRVELGRLAGRSSGLIRGELLIDVPMKTREPADRDAPPDEMALVYLQRDPGAARPLHEASPVIGSLREEFDAHAKKCRIFVQPAVHQDLRANMHQARQVVAELLGAEDAGEEEAT